MIAVGALAYDPEEDRLSKYGHPISLGPSPLKLLVFLMEHPERSFRVDDLVARLWGPQALPDERSRTLVRSHVRHIRRAIEDGAGPWLVREGWRRGYGLWLSPPVTRASQLSGVVG